MPLKLRMNLKFDGNLIFREFLPETDSGALHLLVSDIYRVKIFLSDRDEQTDHVADLPSDVSNHETLRCCGLTMEVDVLNVAPDVLSALDTNRPTEKTEEFGREIFELVRNVQNGLINYFRNIAKQFWLEPIAPDPRNWQNFLDSYDTVWLDSTGTWQRFLVSRKYVIHIAAEVFTGGVDRNQWREVVAFIERGARSPMIDTLISNSLKHLDENNGRMATLESVIALEAAINRLLPKVISRLPGAPQIEPSQISKLIEKAGLRATATVGLMLIQTPAGLNPEDIQIVGEAINARNNVVHNQGRLVEVALARQYVGAIRRVIATFDKWVKGISE